MLEFPLFFATAVVALKSVTLIRHGRTHMNELINGVHYGKPGFTDVFSDPKDRALYRDSPLHPIGATQAEGLSDEMRESEPNFDLVVVSPLTRALQTFEIGVKPHLDESVPVMAHPAAAERLYMVSDIGKTRRELKQLYPNIDFDSAFPKDQSQDDVWNWVPTPEEIENYSEWRPHGQGQVYACLGEIEAGFDRRMSDLYRWMEGRPESHLALVCHYGVIDWLTSGSKFENCEARTMEFEELCPRNLTVEADKVK